MGVSGPRTTGDCAELNNCWCLHRVCWGAFTGETHLQVPSRGLCMGVSGPRTTGDCAELNCWCLHGCVVVMRLLGKLTYRCQHGNYGCLPWVRVDHGLRLIKLAWCLHRVCWDAFTGETHLQVPARELNT